MPSLDPSLREGIPGPLYALAVIRELGTGFAIGFCFGLFMEAVRFAGDLIGRTAGFAAAEFLIPMLEPWKVPWVPYFTSALPCCFSPSMRT